MGKDDYRREVRTRDYWRRRRSAELLLTENSGRPKHPGRFHRVYIPPGIRRVANIFFRLILSLISRALLRYRIILYLGSNEGPRWPRRPQIAAKIKRRR